MGRARTEFISSGKLVPGRSARCFAGSIGQTCWDGPGRRWGFRRCTSTDRRDLVKHERGVTASPGLYLLGLSWQHTRTSALLGWASKDAEFLAEHIEALARARGTSRQPVG
jgi:hypothetical protein